MKQITTIVFDMYGVIIEESKGNFLPFVFERISDITRETIVEHFSAAGLGRITAKEFFHHLGFDGDYRKHQTEYLTKYLTLDPGFHQCAAQLGRDFDLMLLSNDLMEWNTFLMDHHRIGDLIRKTTISGEAGARKPDPVIFQIHFKRYHVSPDECLFIDNSVKNLNTATSLGMNTILFNRDNETYDGLAASSFAELQASITDHFASMRINSPMFELENRIDG